METLKTFIPIVLTLPIVAGVLWVANWFLLRKHINLGNERKFPRQLIMLALSIAGLIAIAMALPVGVSTRNQVIGFMGLVVSGIFAFSSTTVFANLMAGLMMRTTRPFRAGDFIRVEDVFGRVSERGLLDTEIQTETRQLIAVPNTYLITHPVSVIRSSGTIVSASVSLGYDAHHARISSYLRVAAIRSGLEDPFIHIMDLGDFSIIYKVNGLLKDVKSLLTARSRLNEEILDTLHKNGVEIVSPNFMNQRPLNEDALFIPKRFRIKTSRPETTAEEIIFDKAEEAEKRELEQLRIFREIDVLENQLKEAEEEKRSKIEDEIKRLKALLDEIDNG